MVRAIVEAGNVESLLKYELRSKSIEGAGPSGICLPGLGMGREWIEGTSPVVWGALVLGSSALSNDDEGVT